MNPANITITQSLFALGAAFAALSLITYSFYSWLKRRSHLIKVLTVGVPTDGNEQLTASVQRTQRGFAKDLLTTLGERLQSRVIVISQPAAQLEKSLTEGKIDMMLLGGKNRLQTSDIIEELLCYSTSVESLALLFWDKMPSQVLSLQDYAYYTSNTTVVIKDSFEDHYLSAFDGIALERTDSQVDFMAKLKMGLVRSGLMRLEHANCVRAEYPNIKTIPVTLHKRCVVTDERLCVVRENHELFAQVDHELARMHDDGAVTNLRTKWFQ